MTDTGLSSHLVERRVELWFIYNNIVHWAGDVFLVFILNYYSYSNFLSTMVAAINSYSNSQSIYRIIFSHFVSIQWETGNIFFLKFNSTVSPSVFLIFAVPPANNLMLENISYKLEGISSLWPSRKGPLVYG